MGDEVLRFPIISIMKRKRPDILCNAGVFRRIIGRNCNGNKIPAALYVVSYSHIMHSFPFVSFHYGLF